MGDRLPIRRGHDRARGDTDWHELVARYAAAGDARRLTAQVLRAFPNLRLRSRASALVIVMLVGATRVYLPTYLPRGAHWFTDVAGGIGLGALWLSAILTLTRSVPVLRQGRVQPADDAGGHGLSP